MATIHFLNVNDGDCAVIEHNSGQVTVIDVSNAKTPESLMEAMSAKFAKAERGITGNFQQKKFPVNPISYMHDHGISSIFRYIQTHPDMDHMDGITSLFEAFSPLNFWDTDNNKEMLNSSWAEASYSKEDWEFYTRLRDAKSQHGTKRLTLLSGARGQFYNVGEDGSQGRGWVTCPSPPTRPYGHGKRDRRRIQRLLLCALVPDGRESNRVRR